MRRHNQVLRSLAITAIILSSILLAAAAPDSGLSVQFVARGSRPTATDIATGDRHGISFFGHAYMIIGVRTRTGIKEEIYGFYPSDDNLRALIKGPGMLKAEYRCTPADDCSPEKTAETLKRLSEAEISVKIPVTPDQLTAIFHQVSSWNQKQYRLADQNCKDFVAAVAETLGYPVPARSVLQTPVEYISSLKALVEQENQRRNLEAQRQSVERQVEEGRERLREIEIQTRAAEERQRQAAAAAEAEARRIPIGWTRCTCPGQHFAYGKVVDGSRYHEPTIKCP